MHPSTARSLEPWGLVENEILASDDIISTGKTGL